jgi:hypothetical protein
MFKRNHQSFVFLVLISTLALSSCGGDSNSNGMPSNQKSESDVKNIKSDFVFMTDLIASLKSAGVDCVGYVKKEEVLLAKEEGSCNYNGTTIYPVIFGDAKTTPELVKALKAFGGYWLTSNNWAITLDDEVTARDIQSKLGIAVQ